MTDTELPSRVIVWFSCGAASAVAWLLARKRYPDCIPVYCATGSEHPDSERFSRDWSRLMQQDLTVLKSDTYADTWDVWVRTKWLAGPRGARCTGELKVAPRLDFQRPDDLHVFGYTADPSDVARAERFRSNYFELNVETPLIAQGITKAAALEIVASKGVQLPEMYKLGYQNNNCIPCVKATSPSYWALVRKTHPAEFFRMATLARELNVKLCRIKGERRFIDEIPVDWPVSNPMVPTCDFLCQLAESEGDDT